MADKTITGAVASAEDPDVALYEPITLEAAKLHLRVDVTEDDALIVGLIAAARSHAEMFTRRQFMYRTWTKTMATFPDVIWLPHPPLAQVLSITYSDTLDAAQTLDSDTYQVVTEPNWFSAIIEADGKYWPNTNGVTDNITVTYVAGYQGTYSVNATTNVLTAISGGRTWADTDQARVRVSGEGDAAIPVGLLANTLYYVVDQDGLTFKLAATSGGDAIDITSAGTGVQYIGEEMPPEILSAMKLLIGHWYEDREAVAIGTIATTVPLAVKSLLWGVRVLEP